MRFTILALVVLLASTLCSVAQNTGAVKGIITDNASNVKLLNASVSILNDKDSTLVTFARTAENGSFTISNLPEGKFIVLVTYPEYADYVDKFKLDSVKPELNLGAINMTLKSKLLEEVIIKAKPVAVRIKGDTTEFDAGAYVIQPDSKVEDLLKQLPGIQVDKDGKITAQGEQVNKILLDGEEFFGDDPTLVTKNIRADMVDKVQLYDKKSDQATFTGIDDGVKNKTINIKLKEDKKKGSFGKVDAGIGSNKYYQGQLLYNNFNAKKKIAAFGITSNTGKTGLDWDDRNKFGESNMMMSEDGGYMMYGGPSWDDMTYFGEGIPLARTGGLHYDNKWNSDKHSINTNFKLGSLAIDGSKNTLSQNNLPQGVIFNNNDQTFHNFVSRQKFDGVYQLKIDTTSDLKLTFDGTFRRNQNINSTFSESYSNTSPIGDRRLDTLLNRSNTNVLSNADQRQFNASLFYAKKLKKKGRTLSVNLATSFNERNEKDSLKSEIEFYKKGVLDSTQINDQFRTNNNVYTSVNSSVMYTEPLTSKLSAVINYGLNINNASNDRRTFNKSPFDVYDAQVDSLSSNYKLDQLSNQVGLNFNYKGDKTILNFGTKAASVNFKQQDLFTGGLFKREFINWFPQARYTYNFSMRKSIRFGYEGSTTQPSIQQIQPVRTGNDYLNLSVGNPNLRPSFRNWFNARYTSYKVLSETYFSLYGTYNFTTNPIVSNLITDIATGKTLYQSVNLPGKSTSSYYGYVYIQQKIKKWDLNVDINPNINGNTNYNLVKGELNKNTSNTYQLSVNLQKYKTKKYSAYLSFSPNYTTSRSSLQPGINSDGFGYSTYGSATVYLPLKFQLQTDYNYTYQAKTQTFGRFDLFTWNASLIKSFLKEDNLKLSLAGYDLLNKRTGFNRNGFTQTTATTIRRFFLFSVVYEFNKMGDAKK